MGMDPDRIVESFYIFEYGFLRFFHCFEMVEVDPFSPLISEMKAFDAGGCPMDLLFLEYDLSIPSVLFLYSSLVYCTLDRCGSPMAF